MRNHKLKNILEQDAGEPFPRDALIEHDGTNSKQKRKKNGPPTPPNPSLCETCMNSADSSGQMSTSFGSKKEEKSSIKCADHILSPCRTCLIRSDFPKTWALTCADDLQPSVSPSLAFFCRCRASCSKRTASRSFSMASSSSCATTSESSIHSEGRRDEVPQIHSLDTTSRTAWSRSEGSTRNSTRSFFSPPSGSSGSIRRKRGWKGILPPCVLGGHLIDIQSPRPPRVLHYKIQTPKEGIKGFRI